MPKTLKTLITIVGICAAVSLAAVGTAYWAAMHPGSWDNKIDFSAYSEDFQRISEAVMTCEEEMNATDDHMFLVTRNGEMAIQYQGNPLELDSAQKQSLQNICVAFIESSSSLECIRYYENRISFHNNNGRYGLVYTLDDTQPEFLNLPDEPQEIVIQKAGTCWYHVAI